MAIDTVLGVFTDLHHDQLDDEISTNLSLLITMYNNEANIINFLGLGDLIDTSVGASGPFETNISDLVSAFSGYTIKSITGNHDMSGSTDFYTTGASIFPSDYFTWDLGLKWRIIALSANDNPGYSITPTKLTWLSNQLTQAAIDNRYVVIATHQRLYETVTERLQVLTPAAVSGSGISVTSGTPDTFTIADVGKTIFLRHGACADDTCWGWGTVASLVSGTEITVNISNSFVSTDPADEWGYLYDENGIYNSAAVRAIIEAAGASLVKLCMSGHAHENGTDTINSIEYRDIESMAVNRGDPAITGGLLYLYDDGTWKIQGSRGQTSYNWTQYYVNSATGAAGNSGRLRYDAKQTLAQVELISGASGDIVNVAAGTYAAVTITQTETTWNFDDGAIINGFVNVSTLGNDWSAGVDANGWYTKTGVTTTVAVLTEDGVIRPEGTYSAAAVAGKWDWNGNVLYYLPTSGAPGTHTVMAGQSSYGILAQAGCVDCIFNNPQSTGFNTAGIFLNGACTATVNGGYSYHNYDGIQLNGVSELNTINNHWSYENHAAGYSSPTNNGVSPILNYCIATKNGLTNASPNDGGAGLRIWNGNYPPTVNNCVFAYNHNGVRAYLQIGSTNQSTLSNIITYGNIYRGVNFNGTLNPALTVQYSIIHDTATWGNATHSTSISTDDPLFVDAANNIFKIRADSPARDNGTNVSLTADYEEKVVPQGDGVDIGAYEWYPPNDGLTLSLGLSHCPPAWRKRR